MQSAAKGFPYTVFETTTTKETLFSLRLVSSNSPNLIIHHNQNMTCKCMYRCLAALKGTVSRDFRVGRGTPGKEQLLLLSFLYPLSLL